MCFDGGGVCGDDDDRAMMMAGGGENTDGWMDGWMGEEGREERGREGVHRVGRQASKQGRRTKQRCEGGS